MKVVLLWGLKKKPKNKNLFTSCIYEQNDLNIYGNFNIGNCMREFELRMVEQCNDIADNTSKVLSF